MLKNVIFEFLLDFAAMCRICGPKKFGEHWPFELSARAVFICSSVETLLQETTNFSRLVVYP